MKEVRFDRRGEDDGDVARQVVVAVMVCLMFGVLIYLLGETLMIQRGAEGGGEKKVVSKQYTFVISLTSLIKCIFIRGQC